MAKTVTSVNIKLKRVRHAFVNLETAEYFKEGKPGPGEKKKYRDTFLLDPSNADHAASIKQIKAEAKRICELVWPADDAGKSTIPKSLDKCYGTDADLDKVYEGFKDMFFIRCARNEDKGQPAIVGRRRTGPNDKNGQPTFVQLTPKDAEWPRRGDYINATINLWVLNNEHGQRRVMANLEAIQFVEKGVGFGGGAAADPNAEFEPLEDGPVDSLPGDEDDMFA